MTTLLVRTELWPNHSSLRTVPLESTTDLTAACRLDTVFKVQYPAEFQGANT